MAIDTTKQKTGNQFHLAYEKGKQLFDRLLNRPADNSAKKQPTVKACGTAENADEETIKWPLPGKK
ncbi:hypothetical protein [Chlorobium phaeobacteroides]|jgi:hypothetical protein|uniref:hypothetical protein n=1 Tax=Chlorobium phaeobacteroides TaxID=1096 RepID=UPI00030768ED|nr:hypothetical protein [Chlorobium phaeobacteroides]MBV5328761.1 hypothetical protein [Chlorobium sp.]